MYETSLVSANYIYTLASTHVHVILEPDFLFTLYMYMHSRTFTPYTCTCSRCTQAHTHTMCRPHIYVYINTAAIFDTSFLDLLFSDTATLLLDSFFLLLQHCYSLCYFCNTVTGFIFFPTTVTLLYFMLFLQHCYWTRFFYYCNTVIVYAISATLSVCVITATLLLQNLFKHKQHRNCNFIKPFIYTACTNNNTIIAYHKYH